MSKDYLKREVRSKVSAKGRTIYGKIMYGVESSDLGGFTEIIQRGAFCRSINSRNVVALYQHQADKVLASSKTGSLTFRDTPTALEVRINCVKTTWGDDTLEAVRSGLVNEMSFTFGVPKGGESWNGRVRTLLDVEVIEFSPVTWAAYGSGTCVSDEPGVCGMTRSKKQNKNGGSKMKSREQRVNEINRRAAKLYNKNPYQSEGFETRGDFYNAVISAAVNPTQPADNRLRTYTRSASGLSEVVPADGGFLMESSWVSDLLFSSPFTSEVVKKCDYRTIKNSELNAPREDPANGPTVYWVEEAGEKTATQPKLELVKVKPKKVVALVYITDELFNDCEVMTRYLDHSIGKALNKEVEKVCLVGNGITQPLGIVNSGCLITVDKATGQANGTIISENIIAINSRMYGQSKKNAVWLINDVEVEEQLFGLTISTGTGGGQMPLYVNGKLLNKEVIMCEQMKALGSKFDICMADLSQFAIAGIAPKTSISTHVKFLQDEQVMRIVLRIDGQPVWETPISPENSLSGNTVSPFVTLEARE